MSEHYYTNSPSAQHDRQQWDTEMRGMKFVFWTDAGVFSRRSVDYGSRLLIETMQIPDGAKILDIGCGYGPIGIACAKLNANNRVTMADINERAVNLARHNAQLNGVQHVEVVLSNLYERIADRGFDIVLTNPPIRAGKQVVHAIFTGAHDVLRTGGELWVVIQKKQGAPSAYARIQQLYRTVEEVVKDKGYRIFRAVK